MFSGKSTFDTHFLWIEILCLRSYKSIDDSNRVSQQFSNLTHWKNKMFFILLFDVSVLFLLILWQILCIITVHTNFNITCIKRTSKVCCKNRYCCQRKVVIWYLQACLGKSLSKCNWFSYLSCHLYLLRRQITCYQVLVSMKIFLITSDTFWSWDGSPDVKQPSREYSKHVASFYCTIIKKTPLWVKMV